MDYGKASTTAITMPIRVAQKRKGDVVKVAESRKEALDGHEAGNSITIEISANYEGPKAKERGRSEAIAITSRENGQAVSIFSIT